MTKYYEKMTGLCACMGAAYGEPHCACEMSRLGLPMSEEHDIALAASKERWAKLDLSIFNRKSGFCLVELK